jgi:GNAT superfamily N-acetyltransferase
MSNITIRAVDINEKEAYRTLIHSAYEANEELGIHFAAYNADMSVISSHILSNGVYAAQKDNKLVSTISIRFPWGDNPSPYNLPHIGWFATDPFYQKQGLGDILMDWVEKNVLKAQLKLPAVTLGTAKSHPWLIQMYQKRGFHKIEEANLGRGHTTVYLLKILNEDLYIKWKERSKNLDS